MEWRKDTYDIGTGEKTTETYTAPLIQRDETTNERKGTDFKNTDPQYQFGIFTFLDWVKEEYPEYQSDVDQALRILKEHEGKGNLNAKQLGDAGTYEKLLRTADLLERQNEVRVQISGKDRFETSLKIAKKYFTPEKAFLASGIRFADALSASPLAVKENSLILLGTDAGISPEIQKYIDS